MNINKALCKKLIVSGSIAGLFSSFVPLAFKFILVVIIFFSYAGMAGLILSKHKSKNDKLWVIIGLGLVISHSFQSLMFGELVFFSALIVLMFFYFNKTSLFRKVTLGSIGFLLILTIQLLKMPLRSLSEKENTSTYSNIKKVVKSDAFSLNNLSSDQFRAYSIARFNNGSVISFVLDRVPEKIPYAKGKTIISAIFGSFIPRLIWPSKEISGTAMYLKYTGLEYEGASYGISQLGEAYANFGKNGGIVFMLILGLAISFLFYSVLHYSVKHPTYLLFLPVIFLHGIKVETELNRSLGFMLRVIVVLFLLNTFIKLISNKKFCLY